MNLVSVVVPIYNVESYLEQCIISIIEQSYKFLEIILVNDGSTDSSGMICDQYANKDDRVKVIHKKNGGLSDARNAGLEIASGTHICFIDSDDFIQDQFIERLLNLCIDHKADIAQCDFKKVGYTFKDSDPKQVNVSTFTGRQMNLALYQGYHMKHIVAWNKIYKIELFQGIRYPYGKINEDEATTYLLFDRAKSVVVTNEKLYYDRYRENSIMNSKYNIKRLDALEAFENRIHFFLDKNDIELANLTKRQLCYELIRAYANTKAHISNSKEIQKKLKKRFRRSVREILFLNVLSNKNRITFFYGYLFPDLYGKRFVV